jgi:hypothetical protein
MDGQLLPPTCSNGSLSRKQIDALLVYQTEHIIAGKIDLKPRMLYQNRY